ncbi:MAG: Smr/MutS family protein [Novosphingobium sp.]|nr:Smr/MutS family protein [Novosphingobium sp.]
MTAPRGLSPSEAALWRRVAATVVPLNPPRARLGEGDHAKRGGGEIPPADESPPADLLRESPPPPPLRGGGPPPRGKLGEDLDNRTLDASWDKRLARGLVAPDAEIDLHGLGLHAAHDRLMGGIAQARAIGARVVLVIAGKPRPHGEHDQRGQRRGAIRAKLLDWLAASPHASAIAAIRPAHQRHGGAGAVYVVLRRAR